ncbi:ATP-binding protein [Fusobacterium varium]|uniref:ATP-binding protein n=2 Tax=Fusobacterium TaxID=848 RepID=UPI000E995E69|nr:ATP-binding protein [Fusobacterium varium]HBJ78680.1 PAS domain-containing sensor histidine kinase [Fusobacterium sp.]
MRVSIKSVKMRVFLIFITVLVILTLNSLWAVFNFNILNNSIERILDSNYKSIVAAQNMTTAVERQDSLQLSYIFTRDEKYIIDFMKNESQFYDFLKNAQDNITENGEKEIVISLGNSYKEYIKSFYNFMEIEDIGEQRNFYFKEVFPKFEKIKNISKKLLEINQDSMVVKRYEAGKIAEKATFFTVMVASVTIFLGMLIISYLIKKILSQFQIFIEKIEGVARENYSQRIPANLDKEFNELGIAFNQMAEKLNNYKNINIKKIMTEKSKAEAIVESINDGIIVTDKENKILLINNAAEKLLNIKESELLDKPFFTAIPNKKIHESINEVINSREIKSTVKQLELSLNPALEKNIYCRVFINSIIGKNKENLGIVTLLQDITKLKEIDQMKSDFVSTVSHEFRTPLTSIGMAVELLKDGSVGTINETQQELLKVIKEDSERLNVLIKDLLDLSRLESGKTHLKFEKNNIKKIIETTVNSLKNLSENKNVKIEIKNIEDSLFVLADINKIILVLTNLITNAIKYKSEKREGYIIIEAFKKEKNIIVSVEDNGQGIPEEYIEKIFNKFIQVKVSNEGKIEGTGLGLSICKEIIKNHGGEIWVDSILGKGSTFYFSLKSAD